VYPHCAADSDIRVFFFFHVQSDFSRVFFVRLEFKRLRRRYCLFGSV
jgi:hypothetical protein